MFVTIHCSDSIVQSIFNPNHNLSITSKYPACVDHEDTHRTFAFELSNARRTLLDTASPGYLEITLRTPCACHTV